jgi:hypothetical protein
VLPRRETPIDEIEIDLGILADLPQRLENRLRVIEVIPGLLAFDLPDRRLVGRNQDGDVQSAIARRFAARTRARQQHRFNAWLPRKVFGDRVCSLFVLRRWISGLKSVHPGNLRVIIGPCGRGTER